MKGYHHRHRNGSHKRSKTDSSKIGLVSAFWGISTGNMLFVLHWKCQIVSSTIHICIVVFSDKVANKNKTLCLQQIPGENTRHLQRSKRDSTFFFCAVHLFSAAYLKDLSCHWRERERETEKQSLVEFRFGSRKTQTKNLEWPTISNLHFQQWRWTWNLPCFSFIFCPLPPLRWTVEPTLESANSKMELWGPSGTPGTLQLNKSPKVGLGDLINHFFPGGNMEKAAGFWWEFTEWFQNIRQNDSLNTKTELKLSKYEIKG